MKKTLKAAGVLAITTLILYYPLKKLFEYMTQDPEGDVTKNDSAANGETMKAFSPVYRGKHKVRPHHRRQ